METLEKKTEQLKERERALSMSVNSFKLELESVQETIKFARNEEAKAQKAAVDEEKRLAALTAQIAAETARFEVTKAEHAKFVVELDGLHKRMAEYQQLVISTQAEYTATVKEREDILSKLVADENKQVVKAEATKAKLATEITEVKEELANYERELQVTKDAVIVVTKQLDTAQQSLEQLRTMEGIQRTTLGALADDVVEMTTEIKTRQNEAAKLSSQVLLLQEEIKKLEEEKAKVQTSFETEKLKLFNISRREDHVRNQEAYIRDAYKKAGITYTEFSQ